MCDEFSNLVPSVLMRLIVATDEKGFEAHATPGLGSPN